VRLIRTFCLGSACIAALVLIVAAISKSLDPVAVMRALRATFGKEFYPSYGLLGVLVLGEMGLAVWLLARPLQRLPVLTATLVFLGFTAYHILALDRGSGECGCLAALWRRTGIRNDTTLNILLALVPAILLLISSAFLVRQGDQPGSSSLVPRWTLAMLAAATTLGLALFGARVSQRSLYGTQALWGSFESLDQWSTGDEFAQAVEVRLRDAAEHVPAVDELGHFCGQIAAAQAVASQDQYDYAMKGQGARLRAWHEGLVPQTANLRPWSHVSLARLRVTPLPRGAHYAEKRPPTFGLQQGDLAVVWGQPSYVLDGGVDWRNAAAAVVVTLPVVQDGCRILLGYVLVRSVSGPWMLSDYAVLTSERPESSRKFLF
jgi:hypothetical protein